ncbi:MAG: glycosyltransferase family 4 protein [Actinomycetota bacterium]
MSGRLLNYASFLVTSLLKSLLQPRPDLVVTMTDPPMIGLIGWLASARYRCPHVVVCQDVFPDIAVALGKMRSPFAIAVWRKLNRRLRRRAARVIVVGRDMRMKLQREGLPEDKLVYIPNWAAPQVVDKRATAEVREHQRWSGRFVVMHAGNVGIAQNLMVVIEAAELLRGDPDILFVFMGDGAAKPRLEQEVTRRRLDSVKFLPYQPKAQAQAVMAAADMHLISLAPGLLGCATPSKTYGILATGRPAVAAVEAGSEVALTIEELGCGMRSEPEPQCLAETIAKMKVSPLDEMGRRGGKGLEERFQRSRLTSRYIAVFEEIVAR